MRAVSLLTFLLSIFSVCFGQSKIETEEWILSKFNKYTLTRSTTLYSNPSTTYPTGSSFDKDYTFRFEDPYLIISYTNISNSYDVYAGPENKTKKFNYEYKVPIAYFKDLGIAKSDERNSKTGGSAILINISVSQEGVIQVTCDGYKSKTPQIYLLISTEEEDKLPERLRKAFLHLKTLYQKPPKKNQGEGELF